MIYQWGVSVLTPFAKSINLFDASVNMLRLAEKNLKETDLYNWHIRQADNRSIPMPDKSADLVISGWSISSLVIENHDDWEKGVDQAIREMIRLCRTGGTIIIIETLGTVSEEPSPPLELVGFYDYLEDKYGFSKKWVRTDFKFNSIEEAIELIGFFFGETASESIESNPDNIVPECTGIWWLNL